MKRVIITLMAGLIISIAGAQTIFENLVDEYADQEGFSAVQLTSDMFELYLKKKNIEADDPVYSVLNKLENIMVITQTSIDEEDEESASLKSTILDHYRSEGYSLFKTEKTPGSDLKIYIQKDDDGVRSMGLISSNSFSINLIEMNGDIDLANIASLNRALNIRGLEQLRVFSNNSPDEFFYNYNFVMPDMSHHEMSEERRREIEERVMEAQERMEERQRERMKQQEDMHERSRELYKKYQRFPIILGGSADEDVEYFVNGEKVELDELKEIDSEEIKSIQVVKEDKSGNKANIKIQLKEED